MKKLIINWFKKELVNFYFFFRFKMPAWISWVSLYVLIFILINNRNIEGLYTTTLIVIGISVTIAQTCFAYLATEKINDRKKIILNAGEHFLAASVWMSIALLITFLSEQWKNSPFSKSKFLDGLEVLFYVFAVYYFTRAADSINKGLHRIG